MSEVLSFFKDRFASQGASLLSSMREQHFAKLESLGLPTRKFDAFQYVPLQRLYDSIQSHSQAPSTLPTLSQNEMALTFVDGVFRKDLSSLTRLPKQVVLLSLEEAMKSSYGAVLKHRLQTSLEQEADPFAILNGAFAGGLFLYIPPKMVIDTPVHIRYIQTGAPLSMPRVHLFLGKEAEATVMGAVHGGAFYSGMFDLSLDEGASLSYIQLPQEGTPSLWGFDAFRATLKKSSRLRTFVSAFGSEIMRYDYRVSLLGEGADAELIGSIAAGRKDQAHVHVHMEHAAPSCRSEQLFKTLLLSQGAASFTGKIHVKREAQKTQAYQLNKNLLLSDAARVYSKPNLEIFADDVKASHGSTISQLDEEELLYLQTRGIDAPLAKELLTEGFCREIWDRIPNALAKEKVIAAHRSYMQAAHV